MNNKCGDTRNNKAHKKRKLQTETEGVQNQTRLGGDSDLQEIVQMTKVDHTDSNAQTRNCLRK